SWKVITPGQHKRKVNGILGLLCRDHFPGQVHFKGRYEPAWTWEHYAHAPGGFDAANVAIANMQARVAAELWDFYTCDPGSEEKASNVIHTQCVKLVKDMHYEAQIQYVVNYGAIFLHRKITKKEVSAWWCRNDTACWERIVTKWFTPEWQEKHNAGRERRLLMGGPSHHQGSMSNEEYMARWSAAHEGAECLEFMGWALARKGKASEVTYNPDDPSSAYSNPSFHCSVKLFVVCAHSGTQQRSLCRRHCSPSGVHRGLLTANMLP
ncbi:unnamed protein product, partial [Urochloa humidicola]